MVNLAWRPSHFSLSRFNSRCVSSSTACGVNQETSCSYFLTAMMDAASNRDQGRPHEFRLLLNCKYLRSPGPFV